MHDVTVLVIEDNIAMLSAVESALHGVCTPVLAKTGKSGVAIFKEHRPCVVVLDLSGCACDHSYCS
jgi:CheY-like chemotaxis protein